MAFQNDGIIRRTRVARVRAEYPDQLDYSGSVHSYSPTTHGIRYSTLSFPEGLHRSDELPAKRTRHDLAEDAVARKMTAVGFEPSRLRTGA